MEQHRGWTETPDISSADASTKSHRLEPCFTKNVKEKSTSIKRKGWLSPASFGISILDLKPYHVPVVHIARARQPKGTVSSEIWYHVRFWSKLYGWPPRVIKFFYLVIPDLKLFFWDCYYDKDQLFLLTFLKATSAATDFPTGPTKITDLILWTLK